ncbi:branched-chain amino acid transport system II carrier protein [Streptococcus ictaluri]|uniref:Branched-chain amino acid transport system carrier protein n=1 Tax=Streptococcus ictaluri 707-05 TaxID=764299 RepID=G5K1L4_9STRE|nr:branched-chain amino acid transport system II carrier protein [Streptococcus ictaluri]EHI70305.1 branched-chain amino acid transport system II carrier protein [Streptococcus ictaluri 707-05]
MLKKGFLTGLLLFGIFFGAGNLIFPPALGVASGNKFWSAILGFCLSGVGLAVVTLLLGTLTNGGYKEEMTQKFSSWFALTFLVVLYLTIGPLFAIPRTASVSFEVGLSPMIGHSWLALFIFSAFFFAAAYFLAVRPSGILDSVGKILTPTFALLILLLVVIGAVVYGSHDSSQISAEYAGKAFGSGVLAGYNTLDALAAVAFCLVATETLKQFGFKSKKEYLSTIWVVGLVTSLAFSILYIGLGYLGNKFPVPADVLADPFINKGAYVLSQASYQLFGPLGSLFLSVMVTLTCFTTTVGLIVSVSEFFDKHFSFANYKVFAAVFSFVGFVIANLGLNTVITFSVPVLTLLYPIVIVVVLIILLNKFVPLSKKGMSLTIALVTLVSFLEVLASQMKVDALNGMVAALPFHDISMGWLLPTAIGLLVALLLPDKQKGQAFSLAQFEEDV